MKRNVLNSPRLLELKHKRQKATINKVLFIVLIFFVLFSLFIYLARISRLNIQDIKIEGTKVLDNEEITTQVKKQITGKYFWLIPKSNIFFYSKNRITDTLVNSYKRIKDVQLSIVERNNLKVSVIEREALYTWCGDSVNESSTENIVDSVDVSASAPKIKDTCFFLDKDGHVLDEAPYFSGDVYFKFFGALQNGQYLSPLVFDNLSKLKNAIENMSLEPKILYLQENKDVKIFLVGKNKPEIIFKLDSDFQKIAENLEAAINVDPLRTDLKNKYSSLEYIDLRFGNKVYYKFK